MKREGGAFGIAIRRLAARAAIALLVPLAAAATAAAHGTGTAHGAADADRPGEPAVSRPGEAKPTARALGLTYPVDFFAEDTGGAVSMLTIEVPAGRGAPPHVHGREDEIFLILEGEYLFRAGGECFSAGPGTKVFLPRGLAHAFRVVGETDGRHVLMTVPGGMERLFFEMEERGLELPADAAELRRLAETGYGLTFLPPAEHGVEACPANDAG